MSPWAKRSISPPTFAALRMTMGPPLARDVILSEAKDLDHDLTPTARVAIARLRSAELL
jgi:hypothetical protein